MLPSSGQVVMLEDLSAYKLRYPHLVGEMVDAGLEASIAVPIRGAERRVIGVLALAWDHPITADRALIGVVQRMAEVVGQALARASITDRSTARARSLAVFGAELSTARTVAEVAEGALHTGAAALEADEVIIGVVIDEGVRLERRSPREGTPGAVTTVSLDQTDEPLVDAMASDKVVVEQSAADMVVHYPRAELLPESGESFAAFPFKTIDGRPLGVVAAVWERPHVVDDTVMATLFTMARLCGQTFQRATLHDVEHQLIEDLQDRVTQPLPEIADIDVAARYRPAERDVEMGGDWYAGTALPDGRLGIVLGDVAGHGIDAVADMAQIRALTSALLATGATLTDVADSASQFVATSTVTLASALFATVDPATRALDYLAAGHVPPLVRYPDGRRGGAPPWAAHPPRPGRVASRSRLAHPARGLDVRRLHGWTCRAAGRRDRHRHQPPGRGARRPASRVDRRRSRRCPPRGRSCRWCRRRRRGPRRRQIALIESPRRG